MEQRKFPPGWDEDRVERVLAHCERQSEEEAVAELARHGWPTIHWSTIGDPRAVRLHASEQASSQNPSHA